VLARSLSCKINEIGNLQEANAGDYGNFLAKTQIIRVAKKAFLQNKEIFRFARKARARRLKTASAVRRPANASAHFPHRL